MIQALFANSTPVPVLSLFCNFGSDTFNYAKSGQASDVNIAKHDFPLLIYLRGSEQNWTQLDTVDWSCVLLELISQSELGKGAEIFTLSDKQ